MARLDRIQVEAGIDEFACALAGGDEVTIWWDAWRGRFAVHRTGRAPGAPGEGCKTWAEAVAALGRLAGYTVSEADYWYSYPAVPF